MAVRGSCKVCAHPQREEIDRTLLSGLSQVKTARLFKLNPSLIQRHVEEHITRDAAVALEVAAEQRNHGQEVLATISTLESEATRLQTSAEGYNDYRTALACLGERRHLVELRCRILGELQARGGDTNIVNLNLDPATAARMCATYLERQKLLDGGVHRGN